MELTLEKLAVDHPYYAAQSNYYSNDAYTEFETWKEFWEEFKNADTDMNMPFRFDIYKYGPGNLTQEDSGVPEEAPYYMRLIHIAQRKGIYIPIFIKAVYEEDAPQIEAYLRSAYENMKEIWKPISQ